MSEEAQMPLINAKMCHIFSGRGEGGIKIDHVYFLNTSPGLVENNSYQFIARCIRNQFAFPLTSCRLPYWVTAIRTGFILVLYVLPTFRNPVNFLAEHGQNQVSIYIILSFCFHSEMLCITQVKITLTNRTLWRIVLSNFKSYQCIKIKRLKVKSFQ